MYEDTVKPRVEDDHVYTKSSDEFIDDLNKRWRTYHGFD
jgi:hypothetical protein